MISYLKKDRWSPYFVGSLLGILLTGLFVIGYELGASTGIARIGALFSYFVSSSHTEQTPYFFKLLSDEIIFNWKVLFIVGLFLGSFLASKITRDPIPEKNCIWKRNHGDSKSKRHFAAFIGGTLLLLGARIADGCTSGHAITGGAQFSITSWVFMIALFAAAIPVSFVLYKKG